MSTPILYETHMHTPLCKHAVGNPGAYAKIAEKRGLKGIIVTCHNPIPDGWSADVRMGVDEFDDYVDLVEREREAWAGRMDIRLGLESDYVPGMEGWLEKLHSRATFHYILGSVHPQIREYQQKYYNGDIIEFQQTYFEHLAMAAETGLFDTLSHPDLVKNLAPDTWNLTHLMDDICRALDRIAKTGICMELNTSGLTKAVPEMNPSLPILRQMRSRGIPVVVGADAHRPERAGQDFHIALVLLGEAGYDKVNYFLDRKRQEVSIASARSSLRHTRGEFG